MPVNSQPLQQSTIRLLWSGIFVAGILCLLAGWSLGNKAEYVGSDIGRNGFAASVDMPLHVNAEHSLALKRLSNRTKTQFSSVEPPAPVWALIPGEFVISLPLGTAQQHTSITSPLIHQYQLQTLNAPRAPPLV